MKLLAVLMVKNHYAWCLKLVGLRKKSGVFFVCLFVCLFCGGAKTEYTAHSFLPPLSGFSGWGLMKEHPCLLN
jgi:hypothetical protein